MAKEKGVVHILVIIVIVTVIVLVGVVLITADKDKLRPNIVSRIKDTVGQNLRSPAVQAGKLLSRNNCEGEGSVELTASPMKEEDYKHLIPHGLVIGNHVTPIDHGYFAPADYDSPIDSYDVYAMADGQVVDISTRPRQDKNGNKFFDYRLVFSHSCTFLTYFDLVTSLTPKLQRAYEQNKRPDNNAYTSVSVKAGELIGKIGGQTLDYAVWDTTKPLSGFVVPEHYDREPWKIYTAEPFDYFSEDIKELLMAKNLRSVEPFGGKIDYDIDGKLIGNWFLEGTDYGGRPGQERGEYHTGHFSIAPEHLDPTFYIFSIGDYQGDPKQFGVKRENLNPAEVDVNSGLVKYDLVDFQYITPNGNVWDRDTLVKGLIIREATRVHGCALVQMTADRTIKLELFPRQLCNNVNTFSTNTRIYKR